MRRGEEARGLLVQTHVGHARHDLLPGMVQVEILLRAPEMVRVREHFEIGGPKQQ